MSLINEIRNSRRANSTPYTISFKSISDIDSELRREDGLARYIFNRKVKEWSEQSVLALRASVKTLIKRDVLLSDSLKSNLYYNRKGGQEVTRVGFSFAREGVFIHHGARRGLGGVVGSSWLDRHGVRKHRAAESAGKMQGGVKWFDPIIESRLPQLADIVAEYSSTLQIDATNLYID